MSAHPRIPGNSDGDAGHGFQGCIQPLDQEMPEVIRGQIPFSPLPWGRGFTLPTLTQFASLTPFSATPGPTPVISPDHRKGYHLPGGREGGYLIYASYSIAQAVKGPQLVPKEGSLN